MAFTYCPRCLYRRYEGVRPEEDYCRRCGTGSVDSSGG